MQAHAAGSNSAVTDENSLSSSLCYSSNLLGRQIQNHVMLGYPSPSALGEAIISFSRNHMSTRFADESLNIQTGKSTPTDFSGTSYHQVCSIHDMETSHPFPYPFESPKTVITDSSSVMNPTFDSTSYGFEDFPFVQSNPLMLMSGFSKELSLSLPASQPSVVQCSETNSLRKRHIGSDNKSCNSNNSLSLNDNSYKSPLQDRPILSGSRFFHAMQEILAEIACYALENFDQVSYSDGRSCSRIGFSNHESMFQNNFLQEQNVESRKKHLLSLLQVVDDQYSQCVDEVHTVISAFHAVTELDPNLHARFALPTISLMYRNLREKISSHILAMGSNLSEREDNSFETSFVQRQWALQQLRKGDHQQWRPQRGLPERSVSVLRAWMFQNFLHPYPKDSEKHLLALKSGLTRSQVSNWFINARVRLWKPMIEEMYAEMNRRKAQRNEEETNGTFRNLLHFENRRFTID